MYGDIANTTSQQVNNKMSAFLRQHLGGLCITTYHIYDYEIITIVLNEVLRIDNGGLEYMCPCFCVFSDFLAIRQPIRTYYISN